MSVISYDKNSVLLVEDSEMDRLFVGRALGRGNRYDVTPAASGEEALAIVETKVPDIILLDIMLPGMSGLEVLRALRANPLTEATPILLLSGLTETQDVVEGLAQGANDYVTKPVVVPILIARIEALLRANALVRNLEAQKELLAKLAAYDELTGIPNRRTVFQSLSLEFARAERYKRSLSVLMMDVDHFKSVNDRYGHAGGDVVLRDVATVVQTSLRTVDVVGRYGGEEFCAILPETGVDGARRAGERVRAAVEAHAVNTGTHIIPVTISVGAATFTPGESPEAPDLVHLADVALYQAKRTGRNRVVLFEPGMG
jgi:diguanylate cyclase (GGDEF)-like protein